MDFEPFLTDFDADAPSGGEVRNEPAFHSIQRVMERASKEARRDGDGNISVSSDVDWNAVFEEAGGLAATGRDLRLLVVATRAAANIDGFAGLADGLELISDLIDRHWDSIHPELRDRPDPAEASLRRKNALLQLENDDNGLLGDLKMNAVFVARGIGAVTGADMAACGMSEFEYLNEAPDGLGDAEIAALKARYKDNKGRVTGATRALAAETPEEAESMASAIARANQARAGLEAKFTEKAGLANGLGCRFQELETFLGRIGATIDRAIRETGDEPMDQTEAPPAEAAPVAPSEAPSPAAPSAPSGAVPGAVTSRKDVEKCLDMIIAFYERTEPSSPIPHLARRLRRMVPMDFVELMEEIAPSGMKEFKSIAGVPDAKGN